ncbi:protein involved in gliding motility GldA [Robiginitalea myxolifaciens]|uniref:Protein involved in gliding motility GldA n=1 Tax=Robiginitalea myxolifaciens TaxID=400055 RepID=A0A1I6FRK7_9FLAO|nr:gliding motility-associated ABC transporter ATP-binding subunit GldA [Robiginitalea myxolifaciens]SFR32553.1 protein involved in gliding motility GldA [Robiginitalea myxolifaciens]
MSISVSGITKNFGAQRALDSVSFDITKGEVVGFLGPNGAGKSTLMKILTSYYTPDAGSASVGGFGLEEAPAKVRAILGYLPEHNPLYLELYVREYLGFCASLHGVGRDRVEAVVAQTGLGPEAHKKIGQLSKGYRQRVGLAAALVHDPQVLILDEPTTGLDPNQLVEIRKLIREISSEKTILLSTHIMKEVEAVCDRVLIIDKGKLVADARMKDLRKNQQQVIEVEFDYRVEEVLLNKLKSVSQVKNTGGFVYELTFDTQEDMRPAVFDFAHDNSLKTLQLNHKTRNLEALFTELTTSTSTAD